MQQKLKEKERQIYKDKVQALININHELRTPLTLIISPIDELVRQAEVPHFIKTKLDTFLEI